MEFDDLLKLMVEKGGSDMFITAGVPPSVKINGKILPITKNPLSPDVVREVVMSIMSEDQRLEFQRSKECNFAISQRGIGRFRVSANWNAKTVIHASNCVCEQRRYHCVGTDSRVVDICQDVCRRIDRAGPTFAKRRR